MREDDERPIGPASTRERLAEATVGIVGLGGLGSNVAWMLVRAGVRSLILADFDRVSESNLDRQFYFRDQVGRSKTEALAENLRRIDADLALRLHDVRVDAQNLAPIFRGARALVEAVDTAADKALLLSACGAALPGIPLVAASGLAGLGSANDIATHVLASDRYVAGDLVSASGELPLVASRVCLVAAHQAHMVIRLLLGMREP